LAGRLHRSLHRPVLAGLLLCLAAAPAAGQGVALGFRGGLNSATESIANLDTPSRTTFHAGGILGIGVTETFGLQLEAVYSRKGVAAGAGVAGARELGYLQIPVLGVGIVPTAPSASITPHFVFGPTFGFQVSCQVSDGGGGSVGCVDGGAATHSLDVGLQVGAGLSIGKRSMAFLLDVALDWGLTNIDDTGGNVAARNRTLMASAGFLFPIR